MNPECCHEIEGTCEGALKSRSADPCCVRVHGFSRAQLGCGIHKSCRPARNAGALPMTQPWEAG